MSKDYCEIYDAKYSIDANWLEEICTDLNCTFCAKRPKKHRKNCKCKTVDWHMIHYSESYKSTLKHKEKA